MGVFTLYPNMYTMLVGPTGARKDTAIDFAREVVQEAYPRLNVLPSEGSPQGLASALAEQYEAWGTADGLLCAPEMKVLIGKDEYKRALAEWLTDWYKSQSAWSRRLKKETVQLSDLYVCAIFGTTMDWLVTMPENALSGGFFPRIWIVGAQGKRTWKWRPEVNHAIRAGIVEHLRLRLANVPERLVFSPEADRYLERWYEGFLPAKAAKMHASAKPYFERVHVLAIKLAAVIHVLDGKPGSDTIEAAHAQQAVALLAATEAGTLAVMRDVAVSDAGALVKEVMEVMTQRGGRATKQEVVDSLKLRYARQKIIEALDTLVYTEHAKPVRVGGKDGYILRPM